MVSNNDLDAVVRPGIYNNQSPNSGIVMVWGQLQSHHMYVPQRRVRESLVPELLKISWASNVVFTMYHALIWMDCIV